MSLAVHANIADPDKIYESLVALHDVCSEAEALRVNARLILFLVNHIGDETVIEEAIACAMSTTSEAQ